MRAARAIRSRNPRPGLLRRGESPAARRRHACLVVHWRNFHEHSAHADRHGPGVVHLSHHPSAQSFPRTDFARSHGSRTRMVFGSVAQSAEQRASLRRTADPFHFGALRALSTAAPAHTVLGGAPAYARTVYSSLARDPFCRHPDGLRMVWRRRLVRQDGVDAVAPESDQRPAPSVVGLDRVDAWMHRPVLLAQAAAMVSALRRGALCARIADARLRTARLRPGRARGRLSHRARSRLDRTAL